MLFLMGTSLFAQEGLAIGAAFNTDFLGGAIPGVGLSFKIPGIPVMFGAGGYFGERTDFGVTVDWWLYNAPLVGVLQLYMGPGFFVRISENFGLGGRIPIGLQVFVIDPLELFAEIAPTIGVGGVGGDTIQFPTFGLQFAIGIRFWF